MRLIFMNAAATSYLHHKLTCMKCALLLITISMASFVADATPLQHHSKTDTSAEINTLTKQEKAAGWRLLWNGKNLDGWRTYKHQPQTSWSVSNGILTCKYDTSHSLQHADLMTDDTYTNFELTLEWMIKPRANSGILYMVNEQNDYSFQSGPEYQLLDDAFYLTDAPEHIHASQKSGSNYDMAAPFVDAVKPAGEWNSAVIKVNGAHVEHWLNGQKVADYKIGSTQWKKEKDNSKWKDAGGYAANQTGHIDLQDHGGGVSFKNIKIKQL